MRKDIEQEFLHVCIKRRSNHLKSAIELNFSESELKEKIVNTHRGYPVVSLTIGDFIINGDSYFRDKNLENW